jgi:hypothetical protein
MSISELTEGQEMYTHDADRQTIDKQSDRHINHQGYHSLPRSIILVLLVWLTEKRWSVLWMH